VRIVVFALALVFIVGMAVLTVLDISRNGITGLGVVGVFVVIVVGVGVIGALTESPRKKKK
jgi:quinol-cytochrome oxidoreductase complex cytochrome b subunit